jgi:hypothetical protein
MKEIDYTVAIGYVTNLEEIKETINKLRESAKDDILDTDKIIIDPLGLMKGE